MYTSHIYLCNTSELSCITPSSDIAISSRWKIPDGQRYRSYIIVERDWLLQFDQCYVIIGPSRWRDIIKMYEDLFNWITWSVTSAVLLLLLLLLLSSLSLSLSLSWSLLFFVIVIIVITTFTYIYIHYISLFTNRLLQNYLAYIGKQSHYCEFSPKLSVCSRACISSFLKGL